MRNFVVRRSVASTFIALVLFSGASWAASVEEVVAACDKMAEKKPGSCNYVADDKGLGGCTRNGCFYCPADGSRQCHATRAGGKSGKGDVVVKVGDIQFACDKQDEGWCRKRAADAQTGK